MGARLAALLELRVMSSLPHGNGARRVDTRDSSPSVVSHVAVGCLAAWPVNFGSRSLPVARIRFQALVRCIAASSVSRFSEMHLIRDWRRDIRGRATMR